MGLPTNGNHVLSVDSQGTIWVGGGDSSLMFSLHPGEPKFRNWSGAAPTSWVGDGMAKSVGGTVWWELS